eukprot:scaffold22711_cov57-Phaeocystis_antarctica.AAC.3
MKGVRRVLVLAYQHALRQRLVSHRAALVRRDLAQELLPPLRLDGEAHVHAEQRCLRRRRGRRHEGCGEDVALGWRCEGVRCSEPPPGIVVLCQLMRVESLAPFVLLVHVERVGRLLVLAVQVQDCQWLLVSLHLGALDALEEVVAALRLDEERGVHAE